VKRLTSLILCLVCAGLAWSPAAVAEVKIGFVNIIRVMEQAPQADIARRALEQEFSGRDAKLTSERDAILELERKLQTDAEVMSADQRVELQTAIARRKLDFNRDREELKEDFTIRRNEELSELQEAIVNVILQLAKSENYDLMLIERVLYASQRIDVTNQVLERLREDAYQ
jgi:outer membrane protein